MIKSNINNFSQVLQPLVGNNHQFMIKLTGLYGSVPDVSIHVKTLFQNFFGRKLNVTFQYKVENDHVFFVSLNRWDDPNGLNFWGKAFN